MEDLPMKAKISTPDVINRAGVSLNFSLKVKIGGQGQATGEVGGTLFGDENNYATARVEEFRAG